MRKYQSMDKEVDLDNPKTYSHLPDDFRLLDAMIFKEIGIYYCYTKYLYPDWDKSQIERAEKLIKTFCDGRRENFQNVIWFKEICFLIQDELENLC